VPGLPGDDRVEFTAAAIPLLERRHLDLNPVPPRQVSHPRVGVDPEHPAPGRPELPAGDAGSGADVQDVRPGAGGDDPLHHGVGIAGPRPVVPVGIQAERLRHLPSLVNLMSR